jgi:zinc-finger of acetyl-transferase ESCO
VQENFSFTCCPVCGMVYALGQEEDVKIHAAYHNSHMKGIKFQVSEDRA